MKHVSLLSALDNKLVSCKRESDTLGMAFWGDRVNEKKKNVQLLENELSACQKEEGSIENELESDAAIFGARGSSLRQYAEGEEKEELMRLQDSHDELAAWRAGHDLDDESNLFPPLETLLQPPPPLPFGPFGRHHRRHHGRFGHFGGPPPSFPHPPTSKREHHGHHGHHHPDGFRTFIDRVSDVVHNPSSATSLVPTQEIKSMLDAFLVNLSNQLATTFDGAPNVATNQPTNATALEPEPMVPGAFVKSQADVQTQTPIQTHDVVEEKEQVVKPARKLGRGGFRHKHITCDGCLTGIRGMRYKCEVSSGCCRLRLYRLLWQQCPDYDLCGSCLPLLHTSDLHPTSHVFKAMLHRGLEERVKVPANGQDEPVRHPATCDLCSQAIIGVRLKCLNCPDWDCCGQCSATIGETHPGHSFVKLYKATDFVTIDAAEAKESVRHPHVICDGECIIQHDARIDEMIGCNHHIRGARYKCMHPECPDYDLCEKCEASPFPVHPENHPMLKTKIPLRVDVTSSMDVAGEIAMSTGPRGHGHHRRAHQPSQTGRGDCFRGTRNGLERRGLYSRWNQHREHVTVAQSMDNAAIQPSSIAEPSCPGSYHATKNIYDQDESVSNLAAPIVPDNKCKEEMETIPDVESTRGEVEEYTIKTEPDSVTLVCSSPTKESVTPLDIFSWVRNVTILPGCTLPAGAEFTKTWAMKHFASGQDYDVKTFKLVHTSEGVLGAACKVAVQFSQLDVEAGKHFEVSIHGLKVPDTPGKEITEAWRFKDDKGVEYGQPLRLR